MAIPIVKACVDSALQLGLPEARLPLGDAAILLATEALFSALGGFVWNLLPIPAGYRVDATMNAYGVAGCAVIFAAIVLSQLQGKAGQPEQARVGRNE